MAKIAVLANWPPAPAVVEPSNIRRSAVSHPQLIHETALVEDSQLYGEVRVGAGCWVHHAELVGPIELGRHVSFNGPNSDIFATRDYPVSIGNYCSIARGTKIQSYDHDHSNFTTYFFKSRVCGADVETEIAGKGEIVIGSDVWVGSDAVVLSGATIGHGAVIGANSVVTGAIPPYAVAYGSPARVARYRFSEAKIRFLLRSEWWTWDNDRIRAAYDDLNKER